MPNGDVSPPTDDEISDLIDSLTTPEERIGGGPPSVELARRALAGGVIRELVIQVFGMDEYVQAKRALEGER